MKSEPLLIFDLDDTIFETKSISKHHVESILNDFKKNIRPIFEMEEIDRIIADLWKYPFDYIAETYHLSDEIKQQFSNSINSQEYHLDIDAFSDFELVRNLPISKVLVTTGFKKLQLAKISALNLDDVFEEIHIDEIDSLTRVRKKDIFEHLMHSKKRELRDFIVIGDNPESEIKAGNELGLTTVQVAKLGQPRSSYANHYIQHFQDLIQLLEE